MTRVAELVFRKAAELFPAFWSAATLSPLFFAPTVAIRVGDCDQSQPKSADKAAHSKKKQLPPLPRDLHRILECGDLSPLFLAT